MISNDELIMISSLLDTKFDSFSSKMNMMGNRLEDKINTLEGKMEAMETRLEDKIDENKREIQEIKLYLENNINPLVNEIASAYTSAAARYLYSTEDIESMKLDIRILKDAVKEHSKRLEGIS